MGKNRLLFWGLLLSLNGLWGQKKIENPIFLSVLQKSCPDCADKNGNLLPKADSIETLSLRVPDYEPEFAIEIDAVLLTDAEQAEYKRKSNLPVDLSLFSNLKQLTLEGLMGFKLRKWPNKLEYLDQKNAIFTQVPPALPKSLKVLYINRLSLDYGEDKQIFWDENGKWRLPEGLQVLSMHNLQIEQIDKPLPPKLKVWRAENCGITEISAKLPASLRYVYLDNNQGLQKLPALPDSLEFLSARYCALSQAPEQLPAQLKGLELANNKIGSWEANFPARLERCDLSAQEPSLRRISKPLPASLKWFNLSNNNLDSLPVLPDSLEVLRCGRNDSLHFGALPAQLKELDCSHSALSSLPKLPANLQRLDCSHNQLSSLSGLPSGLLILDCSHNLLKNLPILKTTQLQELYCQNNQLNTLPALPLGVKIVNCGFNQLQKLPTLPEGLQYLNCLANKGLQLPALPASLGQVEEGDYEPAQPKKRRYKDRYHRTNPDIEEHLEKDPSEKK